MDEGIEDDSQDSGGEHCIVMVTFTSIMAIMKEAGVRGPGCGRGEFSIGHACKDGRLVVVTVVQKIQTSEPTEEVDLTMGESAINGN